MIATFHAKRTLQVLPYLAEARDEVDPDPEGGLCHGYHPY